MLDRTPNEEEDFYMPKMTVLNQVIDSLTIPDSVSRPLKVNNIPTINKIQ